MNRIGKALSMALAGLLSACALVAPTASATVVHHFAAEGEAVQLKGENTEAKQTIEFIASSGEEVKCDVELNGTLEETNTQLTVEPTYSNCGIYLNEEFTGLTPSFEMNGCQFVLGGETTSGHPVGGEHGVLEIVCPEEEEILTRATVFQLKCKGIPPQEMHGMHYANIEEGGVKGIRIDFTVRGLQTNTYPALGDCSSGFDEDGSIEATIDAWGYDKSEEPVDIWVEEEAT